MDNIVTEISIEYFTVATRQNRGGAVFSFLRKKMIQRGLFRLKAAEIGKRKKSWYNLVWAESLHLTECVYKIPREK